MALFLDYARSTDLYKELCRVSATGDGNLLERTDDKIAESQTEFLRWALHLANPRVIIETGTNKGLFAYLVSLLLHDVELHTIDAYAQARDAVVLLNKRQKNVSCVFYEGDTRAVFPTLNVSAQFAWLDSGHETEIALSDLLNCYRLRVPYVAVDDTAYPSVKKAVEYVLEHTPYEIVPNPFIAHDRRQAVLMSLRGSS